MRSYQVRSKRPAHLLICNVAAATKNGLMERKDVLKKGKLPPSGKHDIFKQIISYVFWVLGGPALVIFNNEIAIEDPELRMSNYDGSTVDEGFDHDQASGVS